MDAYDEEIRKLENKFSGLEIHHVDRDNNMGADVLSKLGYTLAAIPPGVFVHELHHPSVKVQSQQATDEEAPAIVREVLMIEEDWRIQFIDFIREFMLPPHVDAKIAEAARIIRRSKGFVLVGDNLYKLSALGILMKCVTLGEGKDILREIHEGVCGNHAASRTLIGKAYRSGFFWPTAVSDAEDLRPIKKEKQMKLDNLSWIQSKKPGSML
ncbi:uncharacterized protein LOC120653343 [Panicum virgatum]|uniref:uncharacterized protein LOC120653343 n=1 Tax=Panicum virgatum TaxID=38727 RepID=UPI0019D5A3DB|nr:uncharacterized protein LOC120653343 [Panicum virgatum]